jgi:glutamyl/glutaminyl-tRNA synthetase
VRPRTRFAPSPTGSLHVGNALAAVINRNFGGSFVLRIDDTDPERNVEGGREAIVRDLEWLGIAWDEGPFPQSERQARYEQVADLLVERGLAYRDDDGAVRARGEHEPTLLRAGGGATYLLASAVDDADYGITHVIRGKDLKPRTALQASIIAALDAGVPEFVHHGLMLGPDGHKLSKRDPMSSLDDLRIAGIPGEAVRRYLDELGMPRNDVHYDVERIKRLSLETIEAMSDEELAERLSLPVDVVPAVRGAHDLNEARELARAILDAEPGRVGEEARPTLERLRELVSANGIDAKALIRELKAVGGDLHAVRVALTGRDKGPALWTVLRALPRDEILRRVDAAL